VPERFADRRQAGLALGRELASRPPLEDPIVVALPRGGVPVAVEVAAALDAPLDIALVRKIGAPMHPELGVGAIAEGGQVILDGEAIASLGSSREELAEVIDAEREELDRRRRRYRAEGGAQPVRGRTVVLVDDGLATGGSAVAAARMLRAAGAARVIAAVPVCPLGTRQALGGEFDELVALLEPRHFGGVGSWYEDFSPTSDAEVVALLERAHGQRDGAIG
jgi:predicted phosphoribosyltransferase